MRMPKDPCKFYISDQFYIRGMMVYGFVDAYGIASSCAFNSI